MEKFAELIAQVAKILGFQVERLWPRIVWIYWLETLIEFLMIIPAIILGFWLSRWLLKKAPTMHNDNDIPLYSVCALGTLILLLVLFFSLGNTLATLIDPEAAYVRHLTKQ